MECKHRDCRYRAQVSGGTEVCNYACETNMLRGGLAEDCDKYRPRTKEKDASGEEPQW